MNKVGKNLSLKVTAPLAALGAASWKLAGDFDQSFRKVNVMLGASGAEVDKYKSQILGISDATGKSAAEVSDAFYQIVSAGYRGADAIDILTTAMKGAEGGAADTIQTTAALTKAMNIFQLEGAEGSTKAMDAFFGIVDSGLLSFEEMSNSFPRAAANAVALGLDIYETGAVFATLTKTMGSTEQAATGTDAIMRALIKPSTALQALYEEWGVKTGPEAIKVFGGFDGVLKKVQDETKGNIAVTKELFTDSQALGAMNQLLTTSYDDYGVALDTITNSTGRTGEAFDEMTQGPGFMLQQMMVKMKNSMIALGDTLANVLGPILMKIVDGIRLASKVFEAMPAPIRSTIVVIGLLVAAIGPALLITSQLVKAYLSIKTVLPGVVTAFKTFTGVLKTNAIATKVMAVATKLLGSSLKTALGPIGIILVILGLLAGAIMSNEEAMKTLREAFKKVMDALKPLFDALSDAFALIMDALKPAFDAFADTVAELAKVFSEKLAEVVEKFVEKVLPPLITLIEDVTEDFIKLIEAIEDIVEWFGKADKAITEFFHSTESASSIFSSRMFDFLGPFKGIFGGLFDSDAVKKNADKAIDATKELGDTAEETAEQIAAIETSYADMATEAESAANERIQALHDEYGISEDMLEDHVDTKMDLLDKAHEAYLDQLDKELDAEERLHDERMEMFDEEYDARFELLDEDTKAKLLALQAQIDDLDAKTNEEERIIKAAEEKKRYQELVSAVQNAKTNEERARAVERLNEFITDVERKRVLAQRDAAKDRIEDAMDEVKRLADIKRTELEQELEDLKTTETNRHNIAVAGINDRIKLAETALIAKRNLLKIELADLIDIENKKLQHILDNLAIEIAAKKKAATTAATTTAPPSIATVRFAPPAGAWPGGQGGLAPSLVPVAGEGYCTWLGSRYPNGAKHPTFANQVCRNGRWQITPYSVPNPNETNRPTLNENPLNTALRQAVLGYAKGGMVTEPTAMMGLNSGQMGIMAETESELIVPARTFANIIGIISSSLAGAMEAANNAMRRAELDEGGLSYTQRGLAPVSAYQQPVTAMEQAGDTYNINMPGMVIREEADIYKWAREMKVITDREKRMVGR